MSTLQNSVLSISIMMAGVIVASAADGFKDTKGKYLDVMQDGKPLVRYMYEFDRSTKEKVHETYKVYHHVMDSEGTGTITKGAGHKFPHHRAIYIGWNKLSHNGQVSDLWHMGGGAVQKHNKILAQEADKEKSVLSTQIDWFMKDGETKCIEEIRTVTVYHTDDAHLLMDFESKLKAIDGDVKLAGDPEHAGFQYRPHQDVVENKSAKYLFHQAGIDPKKDKDLPWVAETYDLRGRKYTVQHMNHPDNPKGTIYSAYRDYGRFGCYPSSSIKSGESLTLKYRIRITIGDTPSVEAMTDQYETFVK
jgi:hypothetical protein